MKKLQLSIYLFMLPLLFKGVMAQTIPGSAVSTHSKMCNGGSTTINLSGHLGNILHWERDTDPSFSAPEIIVSDSTTIVTGGLTEGIYYYRAYVKNAPAPPEASVADTVTVVPDISITLHPLPLDTAICLGDPISYTVSSTGGVEPIIHQWQYRLAPVGLGTNVSGSNSATYSPSTSTCGTKYWRCRVISYGMGCENPLSNDAKLTVSCADENLAYLENDNVLAYEQPCQFEGWTYYATAAEPDSFLFAINKNGNDFKALVELEDMSGNSAYHSIDTVGPSKAAILAGRRWNINILSGSIDSLNPISVRFFVKPSEIIHAENQALDIMDIYPSLTSISALTFFQGPDGIGFKPILHLENGTLTYSPEYLPYTLGTFDGIEYYEFNGLTRLSGGAGGYFLGEVSLALLPVELLSFEATNKQDEYIDLKWTTATEINNEGFEVKHSIDGIHFETIALIPGAGNSTSLEEYQHLDFSPASGTNYYYLHQIDFNGESKDHPIISCNFQQEHRGDFIIEGATFSDSHSSISLHSFTASKVNFSFLSIMGEVICQEQISLSKGANLVELKHAKQLSNGIYFLKIENGMFMQTKKIKINN